MNGVLRECPNCGKTYEANPVRLKHGRQTTCSRECSYVLRARQLKSAETVICATCGISFDKAPSQLQKAKYGAFFCSRACHYAGRGTGATKRVVTKPYTYTPESKAALIASSKKPKGERAERVDVSCEQCGGSMRMTAAEFRRRSPRFCSIACIGAAQRGDKNPVWRGGYRPYYGADWRPLQRDARKRDGYTCQRCGVTQKAIGRQLDVHHITPVSSFTDPNEANTLDNVITLCHSCHMSAEWESGVR